MSRSAWKGAFADRKLLKVIKEKHLWLSVWSRRSVALSCLEGCRIKIYNGKTFKKLFITANKLGYKLGEFSTTRLRRNSVKKKKIKKHGAKS